MFYFPETTCLFWPRITMVNYIWCFAHHILQCSLFCVSKIVLPLSRWWNVLTISFFLFFPFVRSFIRFFLSFFLSFVRSFVSFFLSFFFLFFSFFLSFFLRSFVSFFLFSSFVLSFVRFFFFFSFFFLSFYLSLLCRISLHSPTYLLFKSDISRYIPWLMSILCLTL